MKISERKLGEVWKDEFDVKRYGAWRVKASNSGIVYNYRTKRQALETSRQVTAFERYKIR